jgi:glycosyltransferase involved in cell wall biosynthesis
VAIRSRPHIVGGFHLLLNGLTAALIARVIGARSLYFCGGGRREVEGGGYATENRLFRMLALPDPVIERRLLDVVGTFDIIVTTGQKTIQFFEQHGIKGQFHIIPGGFDSSRFYPANHPPDADLILVGRLSSVKRVDVFLQAIRLARKEFPDISAIIVGDGPMGDPLKDLADELGVSSNVRFVGQQHRVEEWLRRAKIFVLTSDSEGLSLAMMEAMLSGLPPIVSEVGDLGEMVEDGVNGFLIHDRRPEVFADRILSLLREPNRLHRFSQSARRSVERFDVANVGRLWNDILQTDNLRDQCIITTPPATDRNKP